MKIIISVAIRMRSCSGNTRTSSRSVCRQSSDDASHQEQQLTAGDLRDMSNNPELSDLCYGFMHNQLHIGRGPKWIYWLCLEQ